MSSSGETPALLTLELLHWRCERLGSCVLSGVHAAHAQAGLAQRHHDEPHSRQRLRRALQPGPYGPGRLAGQRPPIRLLDSRGRLRPRRRVPHRARRAGRPRQHRRAQSPSNREFMAALRDAWERPNGLARTGVGSSKSGHSFCVPSPSWYSKAAEVVPARLLNSASNSTSQPGPKPPKTSSAYGAKGMTEPT